MQLGIQPSPGDVPIALGDLYAVEQFAANFSSILTVATLRWQLRHRDTNGLAPACVNVGKKLLISKARYEAWLCERAGASA